MLYIIYILLKYAEHSLSQGTLLYVKCVTVIILRSTTVKPRSAARKGCATLRVDIVCEYWCSTKMVLERLGVLPTMKCWTAVWWNCRDFVMS